MAILCLKKGTVSVNLSNPPRKDGEAGFTTVPLKPVSDNIHHEPESISTIILHNA